MRKTPLAIILFLAVFRLNAMADTVTLKDGTKIEGKITQESASQITVSIQVSAAISDDRIVKREEIQAIEKTPPEEIAFQQIQALKPDPMSTLSTEAYQGMIASLKAFLDQYPDTAHKADVQAIIDAFGDDQRHKAAGETKLFGLWISPKETHARALQLQGQRLFLEMKASVSQGDVTGALNQFDQLEKDCATTRAYPLAVEFVKPLESALLSRVTTGIADLKLEDEKWQQGVDVTPEPTKSQIIAARKAERDRYDALVADKSRMWPPFIPQSPSDLAALSALLTKEIPRLLALPVDKMNAATALNDKASGLFAANNLPAAKSILRDAGQLWPLNEETVYMQRLIDLREHPVEDAETTAKVALRPTPTIVATPTPKPTPKIVSTPAPTPVPVKETWVDFFFTIKGAATVVGCAVALMVIVSVFQKMQKSKQQDMEDEVEEEEGKP